MNAEEKAISRLVARMNALVDKAVRQEMLRRGLDPDDPKAYQREYIIAAAALVEVLKRDK